MARRGLIAAGFFWLGLLALIALAPPTPASATVFEVSSRSDHKPGKCSPKDCTLREAVIRANHHDGADKIRVPAPDGPYRLTRAGADEDAARTGDLDLTDGGTDVVGTRGRAVIRQTAEDRVFQTHSGVTSDYLVSTLRLTGGSGVAAGGGLLVEHTTFFSRGTITDNRAEMGGGVAALGPDARFSITNGMIADNRASDSGGGLYISGPDDTSSGVNLSTVTGNRAPVGGGVYALLGDANLIFNNSTVALNEAAPGTGATAGGIYAGLSSGAGVTRIGHTTIASNAAPAGAGHASNLQVLSTVQMENTIVADPVGGAPSCTLDVNSVGHNLDEGTSCGLDQGTDVESAEAALKPLANNGGPTRTMALRATSDAIEAGTCPGTLVQFGVDQRGAGRPAEVQSLSCDIGAFEHDPTSPPD